jgi:hypothetical protein
MTLNVQVCTFNNGAKIVTGITVLAAGRCHHRPPVGCDVRTVVSAGQNRPCEAPSSVAAG